MGFGLYTLETKIFFSSKSYTLSNWNTNGV